MKNNIINIIKTNDEYFDKVLIRDIVKRLIEKTIIKRKSSVTIVIAGDELIKEYNRLFRKKDKNASTLSFPLTMSNQEFILPDDIFYLGDIILNVKKIKIDSKDFKSDLKKNIVHSFLHLIYYSHDTEKGYKKMKKMEDKLFGELNDI